MTIELRNIEKQFGNQPVVSDFSLTVRDGESFVLLGSSGSGKSTILRLIAGLLSPDRGSIVLQGNDVTALPPQKRNVGFVFQSHAIFRHMTVSQNVEFGLRVRKVPKADRCRRVQALLDLVGLSGLEKRYSSELSGGQRQRVALARSLAYEPAVLLLDEPLGALDARIRGQLRGSLKNIQRELRITSILVTHDQEEAFELGDRIGILERGRLVEVGTGEDLYHRPRTEYAATFLGGGNVVVGRAEKGRLRLGRTLIPFPAGSPEHEDGAPVRVLFRPETICVQTAPLPDDGLVPLGQGVLMERTFCGPQERLRFSVEALQGVRPLSPAPAYGQRYAIVDVSLPAGRVKEANFRSGDQVWLGTRTLHVLEPSGIKMLVCVDQEDKTWGALRAAAGIQAASHGSITALTVVRRIESIERSRRKLEEACEALPQLTRSRTELRIRHGAPRKEVPAEAQERFFDLAVLSRESFGHEGTTAAIARRLLGSSGVAVLIASNASPNASRILLCLGAKQSDASMVRFCGRLARHTRSEVSILHIVHDTAAEEEKERGKRHFEQAESTLDSYGVISHSDMRFGPVSDCICRAVKEGAFGLVMIGASSPGKNRADLTLQIVRELEASVVIVPAEE